MIDTIRQWLWGVITASICLAVLESLVPKGAIRNIAKISGGFVMFLVVLQPLSNFDYDDWDWKFSDYQLEIDSKIDSYRDDYHHQMESIIANELSAYISKKTEQMGIDCHVKVETETLNDVPAVRYVSLSVKKNDQLAIWIEEELGIDQSRQYWEGEA